MFTGWWTHAQYSGYAHVNLSGSDGSNLTDHQRRVISESRRQHVVYRCGTFLCNLISGDETNPGLLAVHGRGEGERRWSLCSWIWSGASSISAQQWSQPRPLQSMKAALSSRRIRVLLVGLAGLALLIALLAGITRGATRRGPGGGSGTTGKRGSSHREMGCPPLKPAPAGQRYIQIHNKCGFTVWPAILGASGSTVPPPEGGWAFESGECKTMTVAASFPSLRVWGRTGCDDQYKCVTGGCLVNGAGSCASSGEVASLWEGTLQGHCGKGGGSDFYDASLVDGYNLPLSVTVVGGGYAPHLAKEFNCRGPIIQALPSDQCPFELRVYTDQIPGTSVPITSINGKTVETSPCYRRPLDWSCRRKVSGCRSICKALDQGWIGYYVDNVVGNQNLVNPLITLPSGKRIRWSQQFLQGDEKCGKDACKLKPAWGAYRQNAYAGAGFMKNLVCCDAGFGCSPYQPNDAPGCSYHTACPTLGAGDSESRYHGKVKDLRWPQDEQAVRWSSPWPDWPLSTSHTNYAKLYKDISPTSYSWQYNDASSTLQCCGLEQSGEPNYIITFC